MTDRPGLSKEAPDKTPAKPNEEPSDYYYDDSTGYRIYDSEKDDDDRDEADECAS
jgi:hypothetical protein